MASAPLKDGLAAHKRGDYTTALRILLPLANNGDATAQYTIGTIYHCGNGLDSESAEAEQWYRRAADQGHVDASFMLGNMYADRKEEWKAAKWYRRAAELGHVEAQFKLGIIYAETSEDPIVIEDNTEADRWTRMAANQGHVDAQLDVGQTYDGDANYTEAAKWYRKAAAQGNTDAQYELGKMYEEGRGVPRDLAQAYKWFSLAALSCDPPAIADRDSVEADMTPAQIATVKRFVREWKPKRQKTKAKRRL